MNNKIIKKIKEILNEDDNLLLENVYFKLVNENIIDLKKYSINKLSHELLSNYKNIPFNIILTNNNIILSKLKKDPQVKNKKKFIDYIYFFIIIFLFSGSLIFGKTFENIKFYIYENYSSFYYNYFLIMIISIIYLIIFFMIYFESSYKKIHIKYNFLGFTTIFTFISMFSNNIKTLFNIEDYAKNTFFDPFSFIVSVLILFLAVTIINIKKHIMNMGVAINIKFFMFFISIFLIVNWTENIKISYYSLFFDKNKGYCNNIQYDRMIIKDSLKVIIFETTKGAKDHDIHSIQYHECD